MSQKKGGGSSRNGRDSQGRRLGLKVGDGQAVTAGSIILRQRGFKFCPGANVGTGRDQTLYSLINGTVSFKKRRTNGQYKPFVYILPRESM